MARRFTPTELGRHVFAIEAWTATFATWRRDCLVKQKAGVAIQVELLEGRALVAGALARAGGRADTLQAVLDAFDRMHGPETLLQDELALLMAQVEARPDLTWSDAFAFSVERPRARAGAWYELFPRSQTTDASRHGTFDDVIARLPDIAAQGYDVLYFPRSTRSEGLTARARTIRSRRARRSRQPLCDRKPRRRPRRDPSRARHACRLPPAGRGRQGAWHRDSARLCNPMLARPSMASGPSPMVQTARRRIDALRRKPAEEMRTSSTRITAAPTGSRYGMRCATFSCTRPSTACASSASTIRTPSRFHSGNGSSAKCRRAIPTWSSCRRRSPVPR